MPNYDVKFEYTAEGVMRIFADNEEMAKGFALDILKKHGEIYVDPRSHNIVDYNFNITSAKEIKTYEVECTYIAHQKTAVEAYSATEAKEKVKKGLIHDPDEYYTDPEVIVTSIKEE